MPDRPAAELVIDEPLIRRLLTAQAPSLTELALAHIADGWDSTVWRLGDELAVRLPRRQVAAALVLGEQRLLPQISERLAPTGVGAPAPVVCGVPSAVFPWPWSVVPWFDGEPGLRVPREQRSGWAEPLAGALAALHAPAHGDVPVNPFRGVPLAHRAPAIAARFAALRELGTVSPAEGAALQALWDAAVNAPPWSGPAVWIHGDLHPGNVIARGAELIALIDFGDLTAGDPAYDLGIAWLAFEAPARAAFRSALHHDAATWTRARGWAAAVTLIFLLNTDDDPEYADFGREALGALIGGASAVAPRPDTDDS